MQADTKKPNKANLRLLIILNRFVIGGPAVDTIPLAWHLQKDFEILILYGQKEKDEIQPLFLLDKYAGLQLKKIKYLKRSFNPLFDFCAYLQIVRYIIKFRPHIVHTHGAKSGFTGRVAAWFLRVPVIIHTYHGHFFHSYFSKRISSLIAFAERTAGKITTAAIALSNSQKNELVNDFKILPSSKITVSGLGFDFNKSNNATAYRQNFRNKYNILENDVAIGIVGRLVPVKNHSFFVKVIDNVLSAGTANRPAFFIIGDGMLRPQIEKELNEKNISFSNKAINEQTRVVFTSWLTDVYEVMNGLDIVVLTSQNEGTPLSLIEAGFFKKPVVSTNVGGVKDCIQDGITGFLTAKNDVIAFSEKLSFLIDNNELKNKMGEAAYKFACEQFSKEKEVNAIRHLYFSQLKLKGYYFSQDISV